MSDDTRQDPCDWRDECGATPTVASVYGEPRRWRLCQEHAEVADRVEGVRWDPGEGPSDA